MAFTRSKKAGDDGVSEKRKWQSAQTIAATGPSRYVPEFEGESEPSRRRLIGASAARQKRGKTRFGFTMPQPLAYLQLDASGEFMLEEARKRTAKGKKKAEIKHLRYMIDDSRGDIKGANLAIFERFIRDFAYCIRNFRSVMIDTATELLEVRKLAEWGRVQQIMQMYYGSMYADFRWMVKEARLHDANVWFLHRMGDEYVNDARTGNDVLKGWKEIQYEAQVYVEHDRAENGVFTTTIKECEQNALAMGQVLSTEDDDNDFTHLAMAVFPDTSEEDWQ